MTSDLVGASNQSDCLNAETSGPPNLDSFTSMQMSWSTIIILQQETLLGRLHFYLIYSDPYFVFLWSNCICVLSSLVSADDKERYFTGIVKAYIDEAESIGSSVYIGNSLPDLPSLLKVSSFPANELHSTLRPISI